MQEKIESHKSFWAGKGPCLMLIPAKRDILYNTENYTEKFYNPKLMWKEQIQRAKLIINWPTDGIPTVRSNLGVIFIPAIAGQSYIIKKGQMPWPGNNLERDQIRSILEIDFQNAELMQLVKAFYKLHNISEEKIRIAPYLPDTQGVFDIAHMLYGERIFYDMANEKNCAWIMELLDICTKLYVNISIILKQLFHEDNLTMIHGHGTSQGVFFPQAGVRMSEDTATLLSPRMIDKFILPFIEKGAEQFSGIFIHFCGKHEKLFEKICKLSCVKAIDLGNPESYDTRWLLKCCRDTDTVLYSRVFLNPCKSWRDYVECLGKLVHETGARCIIRPMVFPSNRDEAKAMLDLWHCATES